MSLLIIPIALSADADATEYDSYSKIEEKIKSLDKLISYEEIPLGKINYELSLINVEFENLQNSIELSKNNFEFAKYKKLSQYYTDTTKKLKQTLHSNQKYMEMDDVQISNNIRKNIAVFHNSDVELTNSIHSYNKIKTQMLLVKSHEYIQDTLNEVIVEKNFESHSPQIDWLDVYKDAFNKIQKDEKFHAIPITIDRLMLQYHDDDLLRELLLLRLHIELLIDETTEESSYAYDDDDPPAEEETEEEEPPGVIIPVPKTSLENNLENSINLEITNTLSQITLAVYDYEEQQKTIKQQSSSSSGSGSRGTNPGGSGGSGGSGSEAGGSGGSNSGGDSGDGPKGHDR